MQNEIDRFEEIQRDLEEAVRAETEAVELRDEESVPGAPIAKKKPGRKKKKKKTSAKIESTEVGSSRGIETLFRTAYDTQLSLTALADAKANMLISVNGVIISIIIAAIAPRLQDNELLLIPTSILLLGTISAIVFAILAAQPRVRNTKPGEPITPERDRGILFFGEFSRRSEDEFVDTMLTVVGSRARTYDAMLRNIYGLGAVLRRKFRLLSIAYTSFMFALVLGALSSMIAFTLS